MLIVTQILFVILNLGMAEYHAYLIKEERPIRHGWWGFLYLVASASASICEKSFLLFVCLLLIRKVFFDISLNLFRGLPTFYVSKVTTSLIDKLHNKIFGKWSELYMAIYLITLIILNFFL